MISRHAPWIWWFRNHHLVYNRYLHSYLHTGTWTLPWCSQRRCTRRQLQSWKSKVAPEEWLDLYKTLEWVSDWYWYNTLEFRFLDLWPKKAIYAPKWHLAKDWPYPWWLRTNYSSKLCEAGALRAWSQLKISFSILAVAQQQPLVVLWQVWNVDVV